MKHPHDNNFRRESVAAMAWLALFAILIIGAAAGEEPAWNSSTIKSSTWQKRAFDERLSFSSQ